MELPNAHECDATGDAMKTKSRLPKILLAAVTLFVFAQTYLQTQNFELMKMTHALAVLAFSPIFFSCKKETTAETSSSFAYQLRSTNAASVLSPAAITGRTAAASVQWTSGTASVNQLKFEAKNRNGEVEFKQNVQQQINLFAVTSILGNITVPPGTYSEVEFKAFLAPSGNAPSLVLNGSFTNNGVETPVRFDVNSSVELKAEKENVTVAAGNNYSALNTLDLSVLTRNLSLADLANATRTNGVVLLSASSNNGLYQTMLANLQGHHGEAEVGHH